MTKGMATLPWRAVAGQKAFFITLGGPQAHEHFGRDDKVYLGAGLVVCCGPESMPLVYFALNFVIPTAA